MPTALIADDERLMREQLRSALARAWPELQIVAEARNGDEAVSLCETHRPDIAFLDIRMPGRSGLEAARDISELAHVVFVTAYDQHAVEAFEKGALDYLLKPVEAARLDRCVARLRQQLEATPPDLNQMLLRLGRQLGGRTPDYLQHVQAGSGGVIHVIPVSEVLFFTSDEKYTRVCSGRQEVLIRKPIRELVNELDPALFWQIHRATLVRADAIERVRRDDRGQLRVKLRGAEEELEVSRSFSHLFRQM